MAPITAGTAIDILARLYADKLAKRFGQQVVVANRPGAGGLIGAQAVANSAPDGYTVLFANSGHAILGTLNKNLPFDPVADFAGVALVGEAPAIVVVPPSLGVSSLKEFVALTKAKPGEINYGSAGIGTSTHLAGAYFALKAGIDLVHVPYTVSATIIAADYRADRDPDRGVARHRLPIRDLVRRAGAGQDAEERARHARPSDRGGRQRPRAAGENPCAGHRAAPNRPRGIRRPYP